MSNPRELRRARRILAEAEESLESIEALPRRRGQCVAWSNGVVWERAGDDQWIAHHGDGTKSTDPDYGGMHYSSAHVASGDWAPVDRIDTTLLDRKSGGSR